MNRVKTRKRVAVTRPFAALAQFIGLMLLAGTSLVFIAPALALPEWLQTPGMFLGMAVFIGALSYICKTR